MILAREGGLPADEAVRPVIVDLAGSGGAPGGAPRAEPAAARAHPSVIPEVRLLDATRAAVDERGLRAWARAETESAGAAHSARSYRYPYALVAWHSAPVGVDIERIEPSDMAFLESISTPSERGTPLPADLDRHCASLWSSKEALSKALGDALDYDPRRLGSPMQWAGGQAGPWRAAALVVAPDHVAWVCWRAGERRSATGGSPRGLVS